MAHAAKVAIIIIGLVSQDQTKPDQTELTSIVCTNVPLANI